MIMANRLCESPSNTENAKSLAFGFLKLMPISQLDPNKLNSNKTKDWALVHEHELLLF